MSERSTPDRMPCRCRVVIKDVVTIATPPLVVKVSHISQRPLDQVNTGACARALLSGCSVFESWVVHPPWRSCPVLGRFGVTVGQDGTRVHVLAPVASHCTMQTKSRRCPTRSSPRCGTSSASTPSFSRCGGLDAAVQVKQRSLLPAHRDCALFFAHPSPPAARLVLCPPL
jgi:hypothetical protein